MPASFVLAGGWSSVSPQGAFGFDLVLDLAAPVLGVGGFWEAGLGAQFEEDAELVLVGELGGSRVPRPNLDGGSSLPSASDGG